MLQLHVNSSALVLFIVRARDGCCWRESLPDLCRWRKVVRVVESPMTTSLGHLVLDCIQLDLECNDHVVASPPERLPDARELLREHTHVCLQLFVVVSDVRYELIFEPVVASTVYVNRAKNHRGYPTEKFLELLPLPGLLVQSNCQPHSRTPHEGCERADEPEERKRDEHESAP